MAATKPVNANVDLFNAGTVRGEDDDANALKQVSLPAAIVRLSVALPLDSAKPGRYEALEVEGINPEMRLWRRDRGMLSLAVWCKSHCGYYDARSPRSQTRGLTTGNS